MGHGVHMTRDLGQHTDEGGANINRLQLRDQKNLEVRLVCAPSGNPEGLR